MKKITKLAVCAGMMVAAISMATAKPKKSKAKAAPYEIKEGDGVIAYYNFEDEIEDNELIDNSGNGTDVYTAALDGSVLVAGKNGKALKFGGDEYITFDYPVIEGEGLTIAAWVKADAWDIWGRVFDIGGGEGHTDVFVAVDGRIPGTLVFYEQSTGSSCNCALPPVGSWVHVAAVIGNGKMALYTNGKLAQELPFKIDFSELAQNDPCGIYVGRSNWPDPIFKGAMDDLLIATRPFSKEEIASVYAGVVAPEAE